jgi:phage tail-like protein
MATTAEINGRVYFPRNAFVLRAGSDALGVFTHATGLTVEVETFDYHAGGLNDFVVRLPTRTRHPNLVLTGGLTDDDKLLQWFTATRTKAELREVTVELGVPGGTQKRRWTFVDAYPVRWSGPDLDTGAGDLATETLEIAHAGWKPA